MLSLDPSLRITISLSSSDLVSIVISSILCFLSPYRWPIFLVRPVHMNYNDLLGEDFGTSCMSLRWTCIPGPFSSSRPSIGTFTSGRQQQASCRCYRSLAEIKHLLLSVFPLDAGAPLEPPPALPHIHPCCVRHTLKKFWEHTLTPAARTCICKTLEFVCSQSYATTMKATRWILCFVLQYSCSACHDLSLHPWRR